jgi:hypothetical protein
MATSAFLKGSPLYALLYLPLGLASLYLLVGRLFVRSRSLRQTRYAVTDTRVVITGGVTGRRTYAADLRSLPPPVIKERPDGTGDLAFGAFDNRFTVLFNRWRFMAYWFEPLSPPVLRDIADVRHVGDLVGDAQRAVMAA